MSSESAPNFGALYANHHGWLYGLLRKKLGCSHRAEDLAHDTFLKVLVSKATPALREPRAFLTTVAHGLVVSHWRRQELEQAYVAAAEIGASSLASSPEARSMALEELCQIDAMLDGLPAKARQAFLLSRMDGLTYDEVALELGVSERMVKKYMAQVMLALLKAPHG
ncbi:MAG: sigma-70 family RNA polymerase sigma factor [Rhizobacter sp.]